MKKVEDFICRIDFKKTFVVYFIVAVAAGIFTVGFLGTVFRERLALAWRYNEVYEKVMVNQKGIESVKPDLAALAVSSSDIADILVLDDANEILWSAKGSELAKRGSLDLRSGGRDNGYLTDPSNPGVVFRLLKHDDLNLLKAIAGIDSQMEKAFSDDYFYEENFSKSEIFLLVYAIDRTSGDKIYIVSGVRPVANGELYLKVAAALAVLLFAIYWVLVALWVYADASKSRLNAAAWGIAALFTNLAGLLIYLIYKQGGRTCYKCGAVQDKTNLYCTFCGAKIGETCECCRSAVGRKDAFCRTCGSKLNRKQAAE